MDVPVPVFIPVPEELTIPCIIKPRIATTYADDVDVALEALDALAACEGRMAQIRNLPVGDSPSPPQ